MEKLVRYSNEVSESLLLTLIRGKTDAVRISNIELRISNVQNRALQVSFAIKNLIFGHFSKAKEGF